MDKSDLKRAEWSKSSHSSANGQCVEVAQNLGRMVAIRDSKDPDGLNLLFSRVDWQTFISKMKSRHLGI